MSIANAPRTARRRTLPQDALQHDLRHIRDLVFVRDLLRERGADETELRECDAAIDEAHARLAASARRDSLHCADAARGRAARAGTRRAARGSRALRAG